MPHSPAVLALIPAFALVALAPARAEAPKTKAVPAATSGKIMAGVCVRWSADARHVDQALVVRRSGDPLLDGKVVGRVMSMEIPRPQGVGFADWVGINISAEGLESAAPAPGCANLEIVEPLADVTRA